MSITKDVKAELGRRVTEATEASFLDARFQPWFPPGDDGWEVKVIQLDSTGAATVEVRRRTGGAVFAKFFPPGTEGRAIYDKLLALRDGGFGDGSRYQVV
ncbi:MAG TPA: hypothetical protein VI854_09205, partial [Acidimicrobiia bacterium]|nr:hypothetical protein [Acidimicrobiia bacterium]